jgi:hypothetical protein
MALSTQDIVLAKRRFFHAAAIDAGVYNLCIAFFSWLAQQGGHPDLQVKEFGPLTGTDVVIADVPCKVYAIVMAKLTATAAFFKASDHATTSSSTAPEFELKQSAIEVDVIFFPKGWPMANGFTISSDTTSDGNTTTAAGDGATGVVLYGAA